MLLSEATGYQIKNPLPGMGYFPLSWLNRGVLETSKTIDVIAIVLGYQNLMVRS